MNAVAELLSPETVLLDVDVPTKARALDEAARALAPRDGLAAAAVAASLAAREAMGSTGLGQGVAIPHARIKGLPQARLAFVRTKLAIPFDAPDGKPVSEMLVLLVPEHATEQHLQILADAAQMFCDRAFRERLRAATAPGQVCALFAGWSAG
jgi:PTS system nitrogen regulatory IIA component